MHLWSIDGRRAAGSQQFSFTASGTNGQHDCRDFALQQRAASIGTAVFTYTLGTWTTNFYNTNAIIINDDAIASPYPSSHQCEQRGRR